MIPVLDEVPKDRKHNYKWPALYIPKGGSIPVGKGLEFQRCQRQPALCLLAQNLHGAHWGESGRVQDRVGICVLPSVSKGFKEVPQGAPMGLLECNFSESMQGANIPTWTAGKRCKFPWNTGSLMGSRTS